MLIKPTGYSIAGKADHTATKVVYFTDQGFMDQHLNEGVIPSAPRRMPSTR